MQALLKSTFKMEKIEYRSYIKTCTINGKSAKEITKDLTDAYGDQAPKYSTVSKWIKLFREGREDLEDDPRSGRPKTTLTKSNIDLVRRLIEANPHISYDQIEAATSINRFSINQIVHDHLKMRKLTSRWIPHELTNQNRQLRVEICRENLAKISEAKLRLSDIITGDESWFYWRQIGKKQSNMCWVGEGQNPKTVVKRGRFEKKNMFCIFFRASGPVLSHCVKLQRSITSDYYIENCLEPIVKAMKKQRKKCGAKNLKLLHDNARPHTTQDVTTYLNDEKISIIRHPPYSPDLAPCDFWLFDEIKGRLRDARSQKSLQIQITKILSSIPKEEYQKAFNKWVERMELCVEHNGEYFEHLIK
jgi:histone-lysine N-methyltransferase SETMAR